MDIISNSIAFVGAGNIASAVINGLIKNSFIDSDKISVYDIDKSKYSAFSNSGIKCAENVAEAVNTASYVFLALKPAYIKQSLQSISSVCSGLETKTFVSVAAGVSTEYISSALGFDAAVIRTMPNTPMLIGEGAVAICKNSHVEKKQFEYICRLFSSLAAISIMEEEKLNSIISVNGSSPAYVYLFVKAMLDGAAAQGISSEEALPLILKTIIGSVKMIQSTKKTPEELIAVVASPNGTTLAALQKLYDMKFEASVIEAMKACTLRADEISAELP